MGVLGKAVRLLRRVMAVSRRRRNDDDLAEEIGLHLELRTRALIEEGWTPEAAAIEARRRFGNRTRIHEDVDDVWSFRWAEHLVQDVRFGARLLARAPLFTATAVLCLAAGVGSSVAVFNVADAILFRPLDVTRPEQLRGFRATISLGAGSKVTGGVDAPTFSRIRAGAGFADFIGFRSTTDVTLEAAGATTRPAVVELVTGNYFEVLQPSIVIGRPLLESDHRGGPIAVVLTERLWRSDFGGDPNVLGRPVRLNGRPALVVGVVRKFRGLTAERPADLLAPSSASADLDPVSASALLTLFARLHHDVPVPVAEDRLAGLYRATAPPMLQSAQLRIELYDGSHGTSAVRASIERPIWLGLALTGVLLLVASANTAGLLLARFATRQPEFGIRAAIGASRGRLALQLLVEAMLVASLAAGLGLYAGSLAAPALIRSMPQSGADAAFELRFDWRLVAFAVTVAIVSAAGAATASLIRLWRAQPAGIVIGDTRSVAGSARRLPLALIAAQVACSLLLVVGAVGMWRTLGNLSRVPPGFDADRTFVVLADATGLLADPAGAALYHAQLRDRIAAAPGVARATMAQVGLLTSAATTGTVDVPGFAVTSDDDRWARMFFVGPDYFETVGMPLIRGRGLTVADAAARVAVVNERFARFYFGTADQAIGRTINRGVRIVGVAGDAHYNTLRDEPARAMFIPYGPVSRSRMAHIVRASADPAGTIAAVRDAIAAHDSRLRPKFSTADELMEASVARERFFSRIAGALALLAIVLACGGLYGAVAYGVSQRRPEIAVRIALGATSRDILSLMLKDPARTTLAGIVVGIPGSYLLMRSASSLLFGVRPFDPVALLVCGGALLAATLAAAFWPAQRATRIDPATTFRSL